MLLANVAAKNGQRADAQGQGKEGLAHGGVHRLAQNHFSISVVHQVVEVGLEIELQPRLGPLQGDRADHQHHQHRQQAQHHHLVDLLHAVLKAPGTHQHSDGHHDHHKYRHDPRLAHQRSKFRADPRGVQAHKVALRHFEAVQHQPAGHRGIEHHQQIVARDAKPAVDVPLAALGLQRLEGQGDALLAGPAHGKFHHHHRQAQNHQKQQIHQHKGRTAVFAHYVRKSPHIAQPNGTPR